MATRLADSDLYLPGPELEPVQSPSPEIVAKPSKATRLVSLDAFRGAVILVMLIVNNSILDSRTPPQLTHAGWNLGLHLADYVLPWFIFCVGVSLPFSAGSYASQGRSKFAFLRKLVGRSILLVGLGMFLVCATTKQFDVSLGVLQLIGLAYLIGGIFYCGPAWFRPIAAILLIGGYAAAIMNISFPGGSPGVFQENLNLIHHVDVTYLLKYKMDGLLSTIPAAGLVLFGTMIGDVLRRKNWHNLMKCVVLLLSGLVIFRTGVNLNEYVAFNKPVCSPSYVLVAGGSGAMLLAGFLLVVDILRLKFLALPLVIFGSNPIVAYVLPILFKAMVLQSWLIATRTGTLSLQQASMEWLRAKYGFVNGGWTYSAIYIGVWWIVLAILYRKRLFLKV